ncbi:hypothetical protein M2432_004057 [Mycobacterium sp. OTB74]|nr:hypothetical protein [Mycobacterium sp. OTB74]
MMLRRSVGSASVLCAALLGVTVAAPFARADVVAYLFNVQVRPGYNFPNADAALAYGNGICDKLQQGHTFAQIMGDVRADFSTSDDYQASYLISQATNELCPAQIWQLRNSAVHYQSPPGVAP